MLGRIKGELDAVMAGLHTTYSESDVNLMTREHTNAREVSLLFFLVVCQGHSNKCVFPILLRSY